MTNRSSQIVDGSDSGELTVHATCILDRRKLGVRPRFMIGREIAVTIEAVFAPRR